MQWEEEVKFIIKQCKRKKGVHQLVGMGFAETVYQIWLCRNKKIFQGVQLPVDVLIKEILFRMECRASPDFTVAV